MSVFPSSLPNIDLQVLPTFPANVVATGAVDISKSGLTYTFGLNFQNVIEETNVSDMSKREVLVQDTDTGAFWRVKLTNLPPSPHTHPVSQISDATPLGQALVTAPDEATAQAALDVPPNARTISAGTGLTGGGDLSADRTLALASVGSNQILANLTGSTAAPTGNSLSAILDTITSTRGSILCRGASGWEALGAGTAGQVLTSGGAGADPSWQTPSGPAPSGSELQAFVTGLTLSPNPGDPNNDIDIAPGRTRGNGVTVEISSTITKRLDANWSEGNGGGGLDTGSKAANATYHVFVIRKDDDGTGDVLLSASATSPTVPVGWTRVQRLGAVLTDASGNIWPFAQSGNTFFFNVVDGVSVYSSTTTRAKAPLSVVVPNGVRVQGLFLAVLNTAGSGLVARMLVYDGLYTNVRDAVALRSSSGEATIILPTTAFTNTAQQIQLEVTDNPHASSPCALRCRGWVDYQIPRIG